MTPTQLTAFGGAIAALLSAAATVATMRFTSRKSDAEKDGVIAAAAERVVTLVRSELDRVNTRLTNETLRCDGLEDEVRRLKHLIEGKHQ